jgi:hypothetical protein
MPITQDRLLALIQIVDEAITSQRQLKSMIKTYTQEAIEAFYSNQETSSSKLLAYIQAIDAAIAEPLLSPEAIEILSREREHFRLKQKSNIRAARAMKRSRNEART